MAECDFFLNSHEILSRNQSKLNTQGIAQCTPVLLFLIIEAWHNILTLKSNLDCTAASALPSQSMSSVCCCTMCIVALRGQQTPQKAINSQIEGFTKPSFLESMKPMCLSIAFDPGRHFTYQGEIPLANIWDSSILIWRLFCLGYRVKWAPNGFWINSGHASCIAERKGLVSISRWPEVQNRKYMGICNLQMNIRKQVTWIFWSELICNDHLGQI